MSDEKRLHDRPLSEDEIRRLCDEAATEVEKDRLRGIERNWEAEIPGLAAPLKSLREIFGDSRSTKADSNNGDYAERSQSPNPEVVTMSAIEKALIQEYATAAREAVVAQAIDALKNCKDTLSPEDSGLKNVWEEICAQVQGEESCDWDSYLDTMRDFVLIKLEKLPSRDLKALWLKTDEGWSWQYDVNNEEPQTNASANQSSDTPSIPFVLDEIAANIVQQLLSLADEYSNKNIDAYLHGGEDDEEEDDELRETLIELMPRGSMVMDLWDWDIHFEETFDDITEVAFSEGDELAQHADALADNFIGWIDEYGMDYNQEDSTPEEFSESIKKQCLDFMTKWRAAVRKEFDR